MKTKLSIFAIILLASMVILNFIYTTQTFSEIQALKESKDKPTKIVYVQSKDGKTPIKGIDYFDGANGISAMSYTIQTTTIQEVPLVGEKGKDGKDGVNGSDGLNGTNAPIQQIRINPENGNLESKLESDIFWLVLIPCSNLQIGCPQ